MAKGEMVAKMYKIRKRILRNKSVKSGLIKALAAFAVFVLPVLSGGISGMPAMAAAQTAVTLKAEGNQAEVSLELPSGNQTEQQGHSEIKTLQLSFQVNILHGEGESCQVSFLFDEGIVSSVKQFSYQEETGLLQIYLSGEQNLYESSHVILGKIVVEANGSADVTASIRVIEDSLKTVNDAFDLQEQSFHAPDMVQVTTEKQQTVKEGGAYEEAAALETRSAQEGAEQFEDAIAAGWNGSKEKLTGETETAAGGDVGSEQEPLLRLVETEKGSRFSPHHFSFQSLLADKKVRVVLAVVAVAAAALVVGTITRIVHNRKKKKKTWW